MMNASIGGIILLSFSFIGLSFALTGSEISIDLEQHRIVVESLQNQTNLLKWGAATIISSLVTVIGILYSYSLRQSRMILRKLEQWNEAQLKILDDTNRATIEAVKVSEKEHMVLERLSSAVRLLSKKIEYCPNRADKETKEQKEN